MEPNYGLMHYPSGEVSFVSAICNDFKASTAGFVCLRPLSRDVLCIPLAHPYKNMLALKQSLSGQAPPRLHCLPSVKEHMCLLMNYSQVHCK